MLAEWVELSENSAASKNTSQCIQVKLKKHVIPTPQNGAYIQFACLFINGMQQAKYVHNQELKLVCTQNMRQKMDHDLKSTCLAFHVLLPQLLNIPRLALEQQYAKQITKILVLTLPIYKNNFTIITLLYHWLVSNEI